MDKSDQATSRRYIFFLRKPDEEAARHAVEYLRELRIRVLSRQGSAALVAVATQEQAEAASESGLFSAIFGENIEPEQLETLEPDQQDAANVWNTLQSPEYQELGYDPSPEGATWGDLKGGPEGPEVLYDPEDLGQRLLDFLGMDEDELVERYGDEEAPPLVGETFVEYERELRELFEHATPAYDVARAAYFLDTPYREAFVEYYEELLDIWRSTRTCWKMEHEISVGMLLVESAEDEALQIDEEEFRTLQARITDGLDWLAEEAPPDANLSWVYDWQRVRISIPNGTGDVDAHDYCIPPAMGEVNYNGNTYSSDWHGFVHYREDMRRHNRSSDAIVILFTPYASNHTGYAQVGDRLAVFIKRGEYWGIAGINTIDRRGAHEVCHLFGASDEYPSVSGGTPCSNCESTHGCYEIPNGNCYPCARPLQGCVMLAAQRKICDWTRGQIGWAGLFVSLTTDGAREAGTKDDVWLDIGDGTFLLRNPDYPDREPGNVAGYALSYRDVANRDIKRIGIRKAPDSLDGGWKLERVRVWLYGSLVCDEDQIDQWLTGNYRWWASEISGTSTDIVNHLQVRVTTADGPPSVMVDDLTLDMGGRSWTLHNPHASRFQPGQTDRFDLDPGTGLYRSALSEVRIQQSSGVFAGPWHLEGLQIHVNGSCIYDNQDINQWLRGDDDWRSALA